MSKHSSNVTARVELVAAIKRLVFPMLHQRGFHQMENDEQGSVLIYFWHRPAPAGGYQLLDLIFDAKGRPAFYGMIQIVGESGLTLASGKHIEASKVHANHHLKRVFVQRRNQNVLGKILPIWFKHTFFGTATTSDKSRAKVLAEEVCAEFLQCFPQVEDWYRKGVLGPNLLEAEIAIEAKKK